MPYTYEFGQYRQEVADLETQTRQAISDIFSMEEMPERQVFLHEQIPAFVGMGTKMMVFRLSNPNLVAKLGMATALDSFDGAIDYPDQHRDMDKVTAALERGSGVPRVEQLYAQSIGQPTEVPAVITRYIPGPTLSALITVEAPQPLVLPTDPHVFSSMADTLCAMEDNGIMPEESSTNIIYSAADRRFHFIDYYRSEDVTEAATAADAALMLAKHFEPIYLDMPLPPAAYLFRDACRAKFGRAVALDIEDHWRYREQVSYNPEDWPY